MRSAPLSENQANAEATAPAKAHEDAAPSPAPQEAVHKLRRRRLGLLAVVLLGALAVVLVLDWHLLIALPGRCLTLLKTAGPAAFFGAMAVLPALGFPLAPFNLTAAPAFSAELGLLPVLGLASAAIAFNVTLGYVLSRYLCRPLLLRLLTWLGYRIPEIPAGREALVTCLVRITPGPPFFLQSMLLGVARVPFGIYLLISWGIATLYASLAILGGEALMTGNVRLGLLAFAAFGVLAIGFKLLRKKLT